ncbi:hypothetical protein [Deinococcus ruber]|uniref:Uncharacterized protein n=1 Tax=Deinococcus ruber TaxID=1848197 RepID=A0A918C8W6_9DEIO|nr:hypothetical protein [Deinococcus ruber]GGR12757.1 hypothetical protein GCM10008957_27110 [Deinococcus ruber]
MSIEVPLISLPPIAVPQTITTESSTLEGSASSQPETVLTTPSKRPANKQFDDIYITTFGVEVSYIHVLRDHRLDATIGKYHSQNKGDDWLVEALTEAAALSRTRSVIRIHTTEAPLAELIRNFRQNDEARFKELKRHLTSSGKTFQLARPERETPMWRELMRLMQNGKTLTPSPLVTYMVHTAAMTDYEQVYCGVVMVGLGSIVVYARKSDGDDLVHAELEMMQWVIENAGGGGRLDVHHSSDGARRMWEQSAHLSTMSGSDTLGNAGAKLRALVREAAKQRTQISPARVPNPILDRFAKAAAATCWLGTNVM